MLALRQHRKKKNIKRKAKIRPVECTSSELYNALQQAWDFMAPNFILFDIRKKQQYEALHIRSAIHLNCVQLFDTKMDTESITFQDLSPSQAMKDSHLKSKQIYIYDAYPSEEKKSNDDDKIQIEQRMNVLMSLLKNTANISSFHILNVSFSSFDKKYPFLCISANNEEQNHSDSYPNEVIESKVFLGDGNHAENIQIMQQLNITHVINVTDIIQNQFEDHKDVKISYLNIKIDDVNSVNIHQYFDQCNAFIDDVMNKDNYRVMVHCMMGVSRSATIVIAYVMYKYKYSFKTAYEFVKKRRSCICPNESFEQQLEQYEKLLLDLNDNNDDDEIKSLQNKNSSYWI